MTRPEERLRTLPAPGEEDAARRTWAAVERALEAAPERPVARAPRRRARRALVAATLVLVAALAVAFTPPGEALADWLRRTVAPSRPPATAPARPQLPVGGRLLVEAPPYGLSIVEADGRRRRLGAWYDAVWSPHGRFVAAVSGQRLAVLDRRGAVRWSLRRPFELREPAWAPDGRMVAYRSANGLRVVAGDGTGDRLVAGPMGFGRPAWRPGAGHVVAWADRGGRVRLLDVASGRTSWVSGGGPQARFLVWSRSGSTLAAVSGHSVRLFDRGGRLLRRIRMARGQSIEAATFARRGSGPLTLAVHDFRRGWSEIVLTAARGPGGLRRMFSGRGRMIDLAWSPTGSWLLVAWRGADEWLFLHSAAVDRVTAIEDVTRFVNPRAPGLWAFPRLRGWCCPP